jgi:hypothetical protein
MTLIHLILLIKDKNFLFFLLFSLTLILFWKDNHRDAAHVWQYLYDMIFNKKKLYCVLNVLFLICIIMTCCVFLKLKEQAVLVAYVVWREETKKEHGKNLFNLRFFSTIIRFKKKKSTCAFIYKEYARVVYESIFYF